MRKQIGNPQLFYLFLSSFAILFVGMGLFPVLPLYAAEFGASPSMVGIYLGVIYTAIAAGTLLSGWLSERVPRRGLFIAGGALGVPALALLGQATHFWQVVFLTSVVWFSAGIDMALISVFTGLTADRNHRGRSFGLVFLATPLGALIGGTATSQLLAWQGYPLLFTVLSGVWTLLPIIGIFGLKKVEIPTQTAPAKKTGGTGLQFGRNFAFLLLVTLLSATAISANRIGTSLSMQAQQFSASAVASTATVSGLVLIPLTFLIGALSDRVGRRRFLILGYLLAASAALVLSTAAQLWQFWLAATLVLLAIGITGTVSPAYATDLLDPRALNRGLAWLNTMNWMASILSFTTSGFLVSWFGPGALPILAAVLPLVAGAVLGLVPQNGLSLRTAGQQGNCPKPTWQGCP